LTTHSDIFIVVSFTELFHSYNYALFEKKTRKFLDHLMFSVSTVIGNNNEISGSGSTAKVMTGWHNQNET